VDALVPGKVQRIDVDLREPLSSCPEEVIRGKAWEAIEAAGEDRMSYRPLLIEDTSLDVEGADWAGTLVKFNLGGLDGLVGRRATARCTLARVRRSEGKLWEGKMEGTIVAPRGDGGFGFDRYFLPDGEEKTLGESKGLSPRGLALQAMANGPGRWFVPRRWEGEWQ
jgi:XTP/dITP diphosphohydrolase